MTGPDTIQQLGKALARMLEPIGDAAADVELLKGGIRSMGWEPPPGVDLAAVALPDLDDLLSSLQELARAEVRAAADGGEASVDVGLYVSALTEAVAVVDDIYELASQAPGLVAAAGDWAERTDIEEQLPRRLLDFLIVTSLGTAAPLPFHVLSLLGLVRVFDAPADPERYEVAGPRYRVEWERLQYLFTDPRELMVREYGWGSAAFDAELLLKRAAAVMQMLGGRGWVWQMPRELEEKLAGRPLPEAETDPSPELLISLFRGVGANPLEAGLELYRLRPTAPGGSDAGLELIPWARGTLEGELPIGGATSLTFATNLDLAGGVGLGIRPGGVSFRSGLFGGSAGAAVGHVELGLRRRPPGDGRMRLLALPGGSLLDLKGASVAAGAELDPQGNPDALLSVALEDLRLLISLGQADGFLRNVLPESIEGRFDAGLRWSQRHGFRFEGSGMLAVEIPVQSPPGPLDLQQVRVALGIATGGVPRLELTASGAVSLGPVTASVKNVGVRADLLLQRGQFGPADVAFAFRPPSGAGLAIGAGPVTGGGLLDFDDEKKQYAGMLQLSFSGISLTAIGLLNTRMPDGSEGFSLLIIITGEFPPIQLGFGFTLLGAGGLLGVNRTVVVDVLREGVRTGGLNAVLFPADPIRNAPQIISQLSSAFPPAEGHYIFGPMVKLGWGTPTLVSIELGIALELPSPIRLIIMGRLKVALPEPSIALVLIKVDMLGIIDFDRGEASFDASLLDSRISAFALSGDMAMRARWSQDPNFALAAGGMHPRYTPPPGFPALRRLAISLATGNNPRLTLEGYLAVTSNTFQVGAKLSVYAGADLGVIGTFSVEAYLGFDVLIHFSPFSFIAELAAGAALKRNGSDLFSVDLHLTLTGPKPLHAWGEASFKFLGRRSIGIDLTIGDAPPPEQLPSADPLPLLTKALGESGNWEAQMPPGEEMLVTLGETAADADVLAHPLGRLTVRERVVPLNVPIERFGNAVPSGARSFALEARVGKKAVSPAPEALKQEFAAAQFFEMSDDEKLSRPSFEPMDGGMRFGSAEVQHGSAVESELVYETTVIDARRRVFRRVPPYLLLVETIQGQSKLGAAARSPMRQAGALRYAGEKIGIAVQDAGYVAASKTDLTPAAPGSVSFTEALSGMRAAGLDERDAQVVRAYEVGR